MIASLNYFFPQKKHRLILGILVFVLFAYLISVALKGSGVFETYYLAAKHLSRGLDPYAAYPGFNYFKYSPFFIHLPMSILALFPLTMAALLWQIGNTLLYLISLMHLFSGIKKKNFKPTLAFAFFFPLLACLDLNSNGIYLQSNTLVASGLLLSISFYHRGKYLASAMILAYVTNVKIFPIVLALLLSLEGNKKFIYSSIAFNVLFLLSPAFFHSLETTKMLYVGWWKVLTIDKSLSFGREEIHHYLGLRPVLKVLFDVEFNQYYFLFGASIGGLIGLTYFFKKKFNQSDLNQLLVIALTYILIFNPRTEGPSLVLMGPVYAIVFWGLYTNDVWRGYKKTLAWLFFISGFFLISLSCTDLMKNTAFQEWVWNNNLRGIGIIFFFKIVILSLFWPNLKKQLFD